MSVIESPQRLLHMTQPINSLIIRPPSPEDAQRTFDLIIRCDIGEYGEPDSDLEDLTHEWEQIDLNHDAWLAFTPDGDLVGYAAVLPWGMDVRYIFYVNPSLEDGQLGRTLLDYCERRGPAIVAKNGSIDEVVARTFIAHVNHRDRRVVEEAGYQRGKFYFQMQIDFDGRLKEPQLPAGIDIRTFVVDQDESAVHQLIQSAFDQPGRMPTSYEDWAAHMMRADIFEPDLWFVATSGDEIVGACLCFNYSTGGWVRQLGVSDSWQRKGIGSALLRHAFLAFQQRGVDSVGLSVESVRPDAFQFYQDVGMKQVRQYDEYVKPIELIND